MSGQEDSADKTEKPTKKRLRDARKKGDVPKSKELTSTIMVLLWLLMIGGMGSFMYGKIAQLVAGIFNAIAVHNLDAAITELSFAAGWIVLTLMVIMLTVAFFVGAMTEYLQTGPVFATEKAKPDINRLNPVEGVKKMFSQENLVELAKSIVKTLVITAIVTLVLLGNLRDVMKLFHAQPSALGSMYWRLTFISGVWVVFVFLFVSVLDSLYQRFAHEKKLRMSRRDIKQELKDDEGDPYVKARRKQLHQEWSQRNTLESVRNASAVVTNPTHIAVAILYDAEETVVPVVAAKGEDYFAQLIREAAEEAGVPIIENVALARDLYARVEVDEYVPADTFEAVAQVLRWADEVRAKAEAGE